jgi:hypothetical protein
VEVPEVARAWAIATPLRVKFTTGKPNPVFAKPLPVTVKLAGGVPRSIGLGVIDISGGFVADNVAVLLLTIPAESLTE